MIRGGRGENRSSQVHKSAPKRILAEKGYFPPSISSCALHMDDFPQQQQNYAEHCNIIINVIFPSK